MKQRILAYLHDLSCGVPSPVAKELMQANGLSKAALQARSKEVLSHILHRYSHFSVSTIDSFFQKIIRGFAQELGLQSGFEIVLNQGQVLETAIQALIDSAHQSPQLCQWLVAFAEDKLLAGKHWDVRHELMALGWELLAEPFSVHEAQLREVMHSPHAIRQLSEQLHRQINFFETKLQHWGEQAQHAIQQAGLEVGDFAYGQAGVAGYLTGLTTQKRWMPTQRALRALDQPTAWYSKTSDQAKRIGSVVQEALLPCLQKVVSFYNAHHKAYFTALEVRHFIYALGIAIQLLEQLSDYRDTHNVMLVSDTTLFLRKIIAENDTPFLYEKAGTFYKHFLIDEFQDISGFQWRNLQPLIANGLTEGYDSLVVGDVKQSIYRWRGGDWRLLLTHLEQDLSPTLAMSLDNNWRSKPCIIDFNNTFFAKATAALVQHLSSELTTLEDAPLRKELLTQVQQLEQAYRDVRQTLPPGRTTKEQGYVNVTLVEEEMSQDGESKSWREVAKEQLIDRIEALQQAGIALKDMAILVRNNAEGRDIVQALLAHEQSSKAVPQCRYEVISAESLYLSHSPWVNMLINALKYLGNSQNILAQATLWHLYQVYILQNDTAALADYWNVGNMTLPAPLVNHRHQLLQLPLYELVEALIDYLQLRQSAAIPFLQAFQDVVLAFAAEAPSNLSQFLSWWEEHGCQHALPRVEGHDAITLMTIHQAKGLQFNVVMIPFCAWDLDHNPHHPPVLWCSTDVAPLHTFPVLPVRYSSRLKDTIYARDYYQEHLQAHLDNLNLLYVAFTRPEDQLYIWAPRPSKVALKTTADLLQQTLVHQTSDDMPDWTHCWDEDAGILEIGRPAAQVAAPHTAPPWSEPPTLMPAYEASLVHALLTAPAASSSAQARYGKLVHHVLARITYADDLPGVLSDLRATEDIDQQIQVRLEAQLVALLNQPQVHDWFSADWEVKNEATILTPSGQMLRPDRVLIQPNQTVVIDFKTGMPQPHHSQQIQAYTALLRDMEHANVAGYLLYVATGQIVPC